MKRILFSIAIGILLCLFANNSRAITIGFEPITQDVALGNPATVNLFISGLGDYNSPSLGAFDLYVYYNPDILSFANYTLGPYLGDIYSGGAIDLSLLESFPEHFPGAINFAELSYLWADELNALQPHQFTLASLTFDTIALGSSKLHLWYQSMMGLGDENGDPLDKNYTVYLQPGNVNVVTSVPEPATIILVGSSLAGVAVIRYFRKKYF